MRSISIDSGVILPADNIVEADLVEALVSAERLGQMADKRAREIVRRAILKAVETERSARISGYAAGLTRIMAVAEELEQSRLHFLENTQAILRECLLRVLSELPRAEVLDKTMNTVLRELRGVPDVVIMAHPANAVELEVALKAYGALLGTEGFIRYQADESLPQSDCLIYAGSQVIDVSIPVLVDELVCAFQLGNAR
ncbi:hypothetical protein [Ensifer sp. SL37]|uniref:hypothetical protein n=1 Tax=Ensifer sp. SL37 TaxID=2995137 RepID=UPI0022737F55|nr:hypothetical protein [Ensifer sp. SL37]MCY1740498.1 hypothetical protein [Ensifer sp. SL37]